MKLYGLIGFPVQHSASPAIFSQIFSEAGQKDCEYRLFPLENIRELPALIRNFPDIRGLNVTIPHKKSVIPLLDELDQRSREIGAINVIQILRDTGKTRLVGFNTDYFGFSGSFREFIRDTSGLQALVLGSGGGSRVVQYSLAEMSIPFRVVSRSTNVGSLVYEDLDEELISTHKIIINTTPLGMSPGVDLFPEIPYQFVGKDHFLFDLIYNPTETLFLKKGKEKGAQIKNGLEMLHLQAARAWEIWNRR